MARTTRTRRGVLLLVVLSMLVIFMLIAITFVVVSNQQRTAAKAVARTAQKESRPSELLDEAMYQLLRGTKNPLSAVHGHDLLRDMYGPDGFVAHLAWTPPNGMLGIPPKQTADQSGGQLIDLFIDEATGMSTTDGTPFILNRTTGYYNGRVLTVVDLDGHAVSTRVISYEYDVLFNLGRFRVLTFENAEGLKVSHADLLHKNAKSPNKTQYNPADNTLNARIIVNGHPFNGTGAGYNPQTGRLDLRMLTRGPDRGWGVFDVDDNGNGVKDDITEAGWNGSDDQVLPNVPAALAPNRTDTAAGGITPALDNSDESYDLPDFQNMALAAIVPTDNGGKYVLPSFHRPALINYWATQQPAVFNDPALRPFFFMRPLHGMDINADGLWDMPDPTQGTAGEPDFTGKRANLWVGPWDVDNDGDGIQDSIWIDLGMPARRGRDGRMVKPLFAILCLDLDGRININAHGTPSQKNLTSQFTVPGPFAGSVSNVTVQPLGEPPAANKVEMGQGFGPAEINPTAFLEIKNNFNRLLDGRTGVFDGRYGSDAGPPVRDIGTAASDARNRIQLPQLTYPDPANVFRNAAGTFGMFPDVHGRGFVALDHAGQPLKMRFGVNFNSELIDNPYELDLSLNAPRPVARTGSIANPFTVYELEKLYRIFDKDAGALASRLTELLPSAVSLRNEITTDSFDLPTPSLYVAADEPFIKDSDPTTPPGSYLYGPDGQPDVAGTDDFESVMGRPPINITVVDLLKYRLRLNGLSDVTIDREIQEMLSPNLMAGLRLDVNRILGNGIDDNGNGAIDEPQEALVGEPAWDHLTTTATIPSQFLNVSIDHNNDGQINSDDMWARQLLARNLFVLMMLLRNENYDAWLDPSLSAPDKDELTVRRIAQWAINVVDLRDPDAIMTPFEYDIAPFNKDLSNNANDGWLPDGDPRTNEGGDRRLVWGCEHPELLITETLAFHDRRVKDSAHDNGEGKTTGPGMGDDNDWDQPRIPQGSAFIELYCARGISEPNLPGELYTNGKLVLGKLAPPSKDTKRYPVWRLVVTESNSQSKNNIEQRLVDQPDSTSLELDSMSLLPRQVDDVDVERVIWFSALPAAGSVDANITFYTRRFSNPLSLGDPEALLHPGQYAVVGPRNVTTIGSASVAGNPAGRASIQEIRLDPVSTMDNNPGATGDNKYLYPNTGSHIRPALGIVVAADPPPDKRNDPNPPWPPNAEIGLSISEPLPDDDYYPVPDDLNTGEYGDLMELDAARKFYDTPMDSDPNNPRPLLEEGQLPTGTYLSAKNIVLQRLANPLLPWNPTDPAYATVRDPNSPPNPYRTVDWMPVDLTVFTGEDGQNEPGNPPLPIVRFASRQRGKNANQDFNIWSNWDPGQGHNSDEPPQTYAGGDPDNYFQHNLFHTLGYLNDVFRLNDPNNPLPRPGNPTGWTDHRDLWAHLMTSSEAGVADYRGSPRRPFPWLVWFNRPYANPFQVMLAPATSQGRLLHEFNLNFVNAPNDAYTPQPTSDATFRYPYGHLLNFFEYSRKANSGSYIHGPDFYRVLEMLRTRSPFVGTNTILQPTVFAGSGEGTAGLHPPFNMVSNYRDPGRVNVNTIYSQEIWEAIRNGHALPPYGGVFTSRRGFNDPSGVLQGLLPNNDVLRAKDTVPTFFANPFRAPGAGPLVPLPGVTEAEVDRESVDVYLTRSAGAGGGPPAGPPLMTFPALQQLTADYNNARRNPYFRYAGMQRLSNLLTTRSNVYAVWITVGYFEVEPAPQGTMTPQQYQQRYPDGYRLVSESGSETGEVERHRAFYIIDRSIPVAFEPGENHNVDQAVRLRRFIE